MKKEMKKLAVDRDVVGALDHQLNGVTSINGRFYLIGEDNHSLWSLVNFMDLVLNTDMIAFKYVERKARRAYAELDQLVSVSQISKYFYEMQSFAQLYEADLFFSPELSLFFRVLKKHKALHCFFENPKETTEDGATEGEVFDHLIADLRVKAIADRTKKKIRDWLRGPNANLARTGEYVNGLFERYSRLLVIRLDFLYRITSITDDQTGEATERLQLVARDRLDAFLEQQEIPKGIERLRRIGPVTAKNDFNKFLRDVDSNPLYKACLGKIWKMEWSRWSGYHYHLVFFFDAGKVKNDGGIGKLIGDRWEILTEGRGFIHNCNFDKNRYKSLGIGEVRADDPIKRQALAKALEYLPKADQFVRVKPGRKSRIFQTGVFRENVTSVGRPRKPH